MEHTDNESLFWKNHKGVLSSRLFAMIALLACLFVLFVIPLKILSSGYLPDDDALRHSGFVMVEKNWNQVLVSDRTITDTHVGWHGFLHTAKEMLHLDVDGVLSTSVIVLFLLWALPPLFMLRRPESWVLALLLAYEFVGSGTRMLFGRPFIGYTAAVLCLLFLGDKLNAKKIPWGSMLVSAAFLTLAIFWRTTWFLFALPLGAFFLARYWRAFFRLLILLGIACGVVAIFSGPMLLWDSLMLTVRVMLNSTENVVLFVGELQPSTSFAFVIISVALLAVLVKWRGGSLKEMFDSPPAILLLLSLVLASGTVKWWFDFGLPAYLVLLATQIDKLLTHEDEKNGILPFFSLSRMFLAVSVAVAFFMIFTCDEKGRWTYALRNEYIDVQDPAIQEGLPEAGGIVYNDSMEVFYQTFFKHPEANWRYILGFEPALMPPDDLKTYRKIQWNKNAWKAYEPWVQKMRPEDRLWVAQSMGASAPQIPELKWTRLTSYIWSGQTTTNITTKTP